MIKKSLLLTLLLALFVPWAANAQETVTIGDGTVTCNTNPIGTYYNYSIAEQLYTAQEIGMAGTISSVSFYYMGNAAKDLPITMYMKHVNEANLASAGITLADADEVFSGTLSVTTTAGWVTIDLDTPFDYDGTSNLLIGFIKDYLYYFSGQTWQGTATTSTMARYSQNDNSGYDTSTVPGTAQANRPNIQLVIETVNTDCPKPNNLVASDVTPHSAVLTWETEAPEIRLQYKKASEENWHSADIEEGTTYTLTGLDPETEYKARVAARSESCGIDPETGDQIYSEWRNLSPNFTTGIACPVPTAVTVSSITGYTAEVSWTSDAENFNLMLDETMIENITNPYTLTGLASETNYTVKVQAICGSEDGNSQWTSGTSFTTVEGCPEGMVCIGTGTATDYNIPANNYYKYSLTEQIYTAAEIGEAGSILSIDYYKASTVSMNSVLNIYIVSTNKTGFVSNSDWITVTANDLVYSGTVTFTDNAWTTIELNNPFIYDGVSNICIVVDNNTGSYSSNTPFRAFSSSTNQSQTIYYQNDNNNLDPTTTISQSASGRTAQKNRIRLTMGEPPACPKPTGLTASNITAHEADLIWTSNADAWQICVNDDEENLIDVTENPYTLTGLDAETAYTVKVRANCGDDGYSDWTTVNFTTAIACPAPTNLAVTNSSITANEATVTWDGTSDSYVVMISETIAILDTVDFEDQTIPSDWTNDALYPWVITNAAAASGSYSMKSGNYHVHNSTSGIQITVTYTENTTLEFDARCSCEQTSLGADWDYGTFYIDGVQKGDKIINSTTFTHYSYTVEAGTHTLLWKYKKDSGTNSGDDCFYVDNIVNVGSVIVNAWTEYTTSAQTYTFANLTPKTSYQVKVKGDCGNDGFSAETAPVSFTTDEACPEGMVCIGTGTNTDSELPASNYYNYSLTEQIYTAAEIGQAGIIQSIDFFKASTIGMSSVLDIYMVSTAKDMFEGTTDWIHVTTSDKVYSGTVTFTDNEWTTIELDNPFIYDGTSNICIVVDNNTGAYVSNTPFYVFTAENYQTLYYHNDNNNLNPTSIISYSGSRMTKKNRVRFAISELPACFKPKGLTVNYIGGTTAEVTWNGDANLYNIDVNDTVIEGVTSPYTLTGLELDTNYEVKVQADCGDDGTSEWTTSVSFITDPCMLEDRCELTFVLTDSYGDGWNGAYIDVVDVVTGQSLAHMSNNNIAKGKETETYTLAVCDGREIQFVWHSGNYDQECSFVIEDLNEEVIVSGTPSDLPVSYTVNCTVNPCRRPTLYYTSQIGPNSVVLNWTEKGESTVWDVAYMSETDTVFNEVNANAKPFTLTGLEPETQYFVKVRGFGCEDKWSNQITFITLEACPAPTELTVENITGHAATVAWVGYSESYIVRYRESSISKNGLEFEPEWTEVNPAGNPCRITGLTPETTYNVQVRSICGGDDGLSLWSSLTTFTTEEACMLPKNLVVSDVTHTSATVTWLAESDNYNVMYRTNEGEWYTITTPETMTTLSGLSIGAEYELKVSPDCNPENESTIVTFTMLEAGEVPIAILDGGYWDDSETWNNDTVPVQYSDVIIAREVIIPNGYIAYAGNITFEGDGSLTIMEGGQLFHDNDIVVTMNKSFDGWSNGAKSGASGYQLISVPFYTDVNTYTIPVEGTGLNEGNFDLYYFDQNYVDAEWRNYKAGEFSSFEIDKGYLYANEEDVNLVFTGTTVSTTNRIVELVFTYNKLFAGWNLVGNPFTCMAYVDRPYYAMNGDGSAIASIEGNSVEVFEGIFVEAEGFGESMAFYLTTGSVGGDPMIGDLTAKPLTLNLSHNGGAVIDRAIVRFDKGHQLPKFQLNSTSTKVYIHQDGVDYAIVNATEMGEMPVSFKAESNDTYTLSFTSAVSFNYLHLIDNMTGADVDLLATPSYSFEARTTDYASRFKLVFATGNNGNDDNFAFFSNGSFVINNEGEATLQVIDITGRIVKSENINGSVNMKVKAAAGVYMLRLVNGDNVKVQKVVIE